MEEKDTTIYLGEEKELEVTLNCGDLAADEYDFTIELYCNEKAIATFEKAATVRKDENTRIIYLDTMQIGVGKLQMKVTAKIPKENFSDGYMTAIDYVATPYRIVKR